MFESLNKADEYINSLYTSLNSRIQESETRVSQAESDLLSLKISSRTDFSQSIVIQGGDHTAVDLDPNLYLWGPPLKVVPEENVYRLRDSGFYSSIRSVGGFAGYAIIEKALGYPIQNGTLNAITDGSRNTFWLSSFYTPAPVRGVEGEVPWLSSKYTHGFAMLLTYYMDRPTLVTEIFIDPISPEPMDLLSVHWTPAGVVNTVASGYNFTNIALWQMVGGASIVSNEGVDESNALEVGPQISYASWTFNIASALIASSGSITPPAGGSANKGIGIGQRAQVTYVMRGEGDIVAGARFVWFNSSGSVISHREKEDFPQTFFSDFKLVDYWPNGAVEGRLDVGVFSLPSSGRSYTPGTAWFDNVELFIGEQVWHCNNTNVDKPTTLPLPRIILSDRYSMTWAQKNPRRESLALAPTSYPVSPITDQKFIDANLQNQTVKLANRVSDIGLGKTYFAYKIGFKELDLRYREYVPKGTLYTLPIKPTREIRKIWCTTELSKYHTSGVTYYILPFADDRDTGIRIQPFRIGDTELLQEVDPADGQVLDIYTEEELAAGLVPDNQYTLIVEPRIVIKTFDGTNRDSKIELDLPPHVRKPLISDIQKWLEDNAIYPTNFDPNALNLYGLSSAHQTTKDQIRQGLFNGTLELEDLSSSVGYIPMNITITSERWVAYQDTLGKPDTSRVRLVENETLEQLPVIHTTQQDTSEVVDFDTWLNLTKVKVLVATLTNVNSIGFNNSLKKELNNFANADKTLVELVDNFSGATVTDIEANAYRQDLRKAYEFLKANHQIPLIGSEYSTVQYNVADTTTYGTKFKPILSGKQGAAIQLAWWDGDAAFLPIPQSNFQVVNVDLGLIRVTGQPPEGYSAIKANYRYISYSGTEDFFSSSLDFLTTPLSGISAFDGQFRTTPRPLPAVRNMTDYITGKIPTLKKPNFDKTSRNYYPIIEYYVTSEGSIVFARDFFRYGDLPARITVEYYTLGIAPRLAIEVTRPSSPSASPALKSMELRVREGSSAPTRETR